MKYYFKPDWFIILVSMLAICGVFMLISIIKWDSILSFLFLGLMVGILVYSFAVVPLWTEVNQDYIKVKKVVGSKKFLKEKVTLTPITRDDLKGAIRVFGSGGYGGYTGWFRTKNLGKFFMLILNKDELVMIETDRGRKFVINYPHQLFDEASK